MGLTDKPSPASLKAAYDNLVAKGWDVIALGREEAAEAAKKEEEKAAEKVKAAPAPKVETQAAPKAKIVPPAPKKKLSGSSLWNVSGDGGNRETPKKPGLPQIPKDATPEQIMAAFKEGAIAQGQNPDEVLRQAYSGRTQ